ncbi:MAG TPA: nucleotide disphospho-sugar-binding domain-containing protein [Solirubrobacteraceae bacterium]|nr:nucleotide disphospho-sugar-binding domain-containing protein [Solirubrobacteraceae bacterium]
MRVVLTTQPGSGHLNSLLGLALALRTAGHVPTVCSGPRLREPVERHGLAFAAAGVDWRESALVTTFPEYLSEQADGMVSLDPALWARLARPLADDLETVLSRLEPALVVSEAFEFGGQLAAERGGLPFAVVDRLSAAPVFEQRRRFAAPLAPVRAALGLPPDADGQAPYRHLRLLPVPARYDEERALPPTGVKVNLGLPGRLRPSADPAPPGDAPLVLASLGTVLHARAGVRETVLEALREEPLRLVLAAGPDADPAKLGPVPPNVRVVRSVAQLWMLPRCAVFVTHGGANSVREALTAGTPLVVVPLGFDQRYHARRCEALGVGRAVPPQQRSAESIRDAVGAVLADRGYAERARGIAGELAALPGAAHAVALLERLAGREP